MTTSYPFASLEDYLISTAASIDGQLDDGWGAHFPMKGREIEATILFADIQSFTRRTVDLTSTETLAFVNNFFAWISAEALRGRSGVVDKYIGDEIMVVFSTEFGAKDAFSEALDAARWMGEHDVLDFRPRIGLANGQVTVGYVGTPLRYSCSVFGRPVALAARCAGVPPIAGSRPHTTRIVFPASAWGDRRFEDQFYPQRLKMPDGSVQDRPVLWEMSDGRSVDLKNIGSVEVIEIVNPTMRLNSFSTEDRAREGVEALRRAGRYWPRSTA